MRINTHECAMNYHSYSEKHISTRIRWKRINAILIVFYAMKYYILEIGVMRPILPIGIGLKSGYSGPRCLNSDFQIVHNKKVPLARLVCLNSGMATGL